MEMNMAMKKKRSEGRVIAVGVVLAIVCALCMQVEPASAAPVLHKVGGTGVWTFGPKLSYSRWAASKVFRVNDVLSFNYPAGLHNVVPVSQAEYLQCKVSKRPSAIYTNGKTRVKLARKGTYFFICSIPGHCQAGMKVEVIAH